MNQEYKVGDFVVIIDQYTHEIKFYAVILDNNYKGLGYYLSLCLENFMPGIFKTGGQYYSNILELRPITNKNIINRLRKIQTFS